VAIFAKKATEDEKLLASAHADLAAAEKKLATLLSREGAAAKSADRYTIWSTERDAAEGDVRRLTKLVAALEAAVHDAARAAAEADARQKIEACRALNNSIAERLRDEGARAISTLMTLARDAAAATVEANRLNAQLPPGVTAIAIGDLLARELPRLPRKDIATEELALWVSASTGSLIGNQDSVTDNKDGTGFVQVNRSIQIACVRRRYASTKFHPALVFDHPGHFFAALRLPFLDRPGVMFDGAYAPLEQAAKMPVDLPAPPKASSRIVQTELVPLDPWPPAGVATEADRNFAS
jgi:hypothetical protein